MSVRYERITPESLNLTLVEKLEIGAHSDDEEDYRDLSISERIKRERDLAKVQCWKESPYAVGLVEVSWRDELSRKQDIENSRNCCRNMCSQDVDPMCGCLYMSGLVCSLLGARRLGNMAVLKESIETVVEDDADVINGDVRRVSRRKIELVVGPYWPMLFFVTYPLILIISGWTAVRAIPGKHPLFILFWLICTLSLCSSLFGVGCRDPGILLRRRDAPTDPAWRWNDQAQTYRPRNAVYDPDCAVVVEQFDHTCPWTGTAIGKRNMASFQLFVAMVFFCLIMDIILLTSTSV